MSADTLAIAIAFLMFVVVFVVVGVLVGIIVAGRIDRLQAPRPPAPTHEAGTSRADAPPAASEPREDHQL